MPNSNQKPPQSCKALNQDLMEMEVFAFSKQFRHPKFGAGELSKLENFFQIKIKMKNAIQEPSEFSKSQN